MIYKKIINLKRYLHGLMLVCYIFLSLLPLLQSGFYSDDLMTSSSKAGAQLDHINFITYYVGNIKSIFISGARLYIVNGSLLIAYYFDDLFTYKFIILGLIIINILLFGYLLTFYIKNKSYIYYFLFLIPVLFQFRLYHDPILSSYGFLQFIILYFTLSVIFLEIYFLRKKRIYLFLSLVFSNFYLYNYEIGYGLILIPIILICLEYKFKAKKFLQILKLSILYIISFLVYIFLKEYLLLIIFHDSIVSHYTGTQINLNFYNILTTFFIQLASAFPLSYYFSNDSILFCHDIKCFIGHVQLYDLIILFLIDFVLFKVYLNKLKILINKRKVLILGLFMLIFPPVLISLSVKYQYELMLNGLGFGYILVYIQYFGLTLILGLCILELLKLGNRHKYISIIIILFFINLVILLNLQNNRIIVDKANIDLKYRRVAFENSLKSNLFNEVPNHASLLMIDLYNYDPYNFNSILKVWAYSYQWKNKQFVYKNSGKEINIIDHPSGLIGGMNNSSKVYILIVKSYNNNFKIKEGYALLGKIKEVKLEKNQLNIYIEKWSIYNPYKNIKVTYPSNVVSFILKK